MRRIMCAVAALSMGAVALPAQTPTLKPEIRPFVGASIPTGDQRDLFNDAPIFGVQAALEIRPNFHVLGTFGWVPGQNTYVVGPDNVSIFAYDAGIELGFVRKLGEDWQVKPFLGLGAGARTYLFESDALADKTCLSGYGAVGTEFQIGPTAVRMEARDNVFCYKSPIAGVESKTRNDVALALGLAYHFR